MTSKTTRQGAKSLTLLRWILAWLFVCQFVVAFWFEFNWDEFLLLDWVYDWQEGKTVLPLQTIYLRAFTWLTYLPGDEIFQLLAARTVMLLCLALTCWFMFSTASRYGSKQAAYFVVICFISFSFVFRHGTSFRMDIIVTSLLMFVVWLTTNPKIGNRHLIIAGFSLGLAGMITVKSIFYVPIVLVVLFLRWQNSNWNLRPFLQATLFGCLSLGTFGVLYYFHSNSLVNGISGAAYLGSVAKGSLVDRGLFPQMKIAMTSLLQNPLYWALLAFSLILLFLKLFKSDEKHSNTITLLAFAIPLLTLLFFVHAFPYYYVFMLAPTSMLLVAFYDNWLSKQATRYVPLTLVAIAMLTLPTLVRTLKQDYQYQKQIVRYVHALFPQKVAFIDRGGMISSYDHKGFFMASWQMLEYLRAKKPIMRKILDQDQPKFIIANIENLDLKTVSDLPIYRALLPQDIATLKDNFVHLWGPIFVLGMSFDLSNSAKEFQISVPGKYLIGSTSPIMVNGKEYANGSQIEFEKGLHLASSNSNQSITIKWYTDPSIKLEAPKGKDVYRGF